MENILGVKILFCGGEYYKQKLNIVETEVCLKQIGAHDKLAWDIIWVFIAKLLNIVEKFG